MTLIALTLTVLFATWMAWRGWRRGATGTLAAWLPTLASSVVLTLGLWLAARHLTHLVPIAILALIAAAAAFIAAIFLRRRVAHCRFAICNLQFQHNRQSVLVLANHLGGAALGLIAAAFLSLALACLASTIPFAVHCRFVISDLRFQDNRQLAIGNRQSLGEPTAQPTWAESLGRACSAVADLTTFGLLDHLPGLAACGREVRALIIILNAPRERLVRLAHAHGIAGLADLPEVRDALADEAYLGLLDRLASGDLGAIQPIARHEATRRLLACPEVRKLTRRLTLAQLARDLSAASAPGPCGESDASDAPDKSQPLHRHPIAALREQ